MESKWIRNVESEENKEKPKKTQTNKQQKHLSLSK